MKKVLTLAIIACSFTVFCQQITLNEWNKLAKTDNRLIPKYGYIPRTEAQIKADADFIELIVALDSTHKKGSDHMIKLGFAYLYKDIKTAMFRFNQAYLLDSTNTDIYWGFGSVYFTLGDFERAETQFLQGLSIDSQNTNILTDYGTCFLAKYYEFVTTDEKEALRQLETAISYLTRSYQIDPTSEITLYKLSICYWCKGDCDNAWKFFNACKALDGEIISKAYTNDLKKKCKQ